MTTMATALERIAHANHARERLGLAAEPQVPEAKDGAKQACQTESRMHGSKTVGMMRTREQNAWLQTGSAWVSQPSLKFRRRMTVPRKPEQNAWLQNARDDADSRNGSVRVSQPSLKFRRRMTVPRKPARQRAEGMAPKRWG